MEDSDEESRGMIRRRLLKLEQEAKAKEIAISQEIQYEVFDAMTLSSLPLFVLPSTSFTRTAAR